MTAAASLILNSPYAAPTRHWTPGTGGALVETAGRRPASYEIFDIRNNTRRSETLDKVNGARVDAWRAAGYPGDGGPWERVCSKMEPVFDEEQPLGSTRAMRIWYTTKVCHPTQKSQIGHMLADGAWVQAVNARGGFGIWCWDVAFEPAQIRDIFDRHGR